MAWTVSTTAVLGRAASIPTQARNSPAPDDSPRLNRPPDVSSSVAASIAISAGWIVYGLRMHVPISIRRVARATAVRMTGALRRNRSLLTQNWSKPASSANCANRT